MIHKDAIPFQILFVLSVAAGAIGQWKGARTGLVLFSLAAFFPVLAYASNAAHLSIPFVLEQVGFYGALPLVVSGIIFVAMRKIVSGSRAVAFGFLSAGALCVSGYIALMVYGLSHL